MTMPSRPVQTAPRSLGYRGVQVLGYISAIVEAGGRPPSYARIRDDLGFSTTQDAGNVVRRLERRGFLRRRDTGSRHRDGWHEPVIELRV